MEIGELTFVRWKVGRWEDVGGDSVDDGDGDVVDDMC